jgi:hypothetical protein
MAQKLTDTGGRREHFFNFVNRLLKVLGNQKSLRVHHYIVNHICRQSTMH